MKETIHFFVCRNGFGHQKRVMSIVEKISTFNKEIKSIIHCNRRNFERTKNWDTTQHLLNKENVAFEFELMDESPEYLVGLDEQKIKIWLEKVRKVKDLIKGLIVLDNDVLLLNIFENAMIMGSFFWSNVIDDSDKYSFRTIEKQLLSKYNPIVMGVESIAMEETKKSPRFMGLPWFGDVSQERQNPIKSRELILITVGGTEQDISKYYELAMKLKSKGERVVVDNGIYKYSKGEMSKFSYLHEDFIKIKAVFCRPGIGILDDCVKYGIPVFTLFDGNNKELVHNAKTVEGLGWGKAIKNTLLVDDIIKKFESSDLEIMQSLILKEKSGGAEIVAQYILKKLKEKNE
ncbi:MAG: hypothetical protein M0R38_04400 [Bacteroidia bacterium]|nr:hypothetical protein [Bacteroidia bacterium]